jgi:hypothetical protein
MASVVDLQKMADEWMAEYCDENSLYAWPWYDNDSATDVLSAFDLLAPSILNYHIPHKLRQKMLVSKDNTNHYLVMKLMMIDFLTKTRNSDLHFEKTPIEVFDNPDDSPCGKLISLIDYTNRNCAGLSGVAVTKILHRKRPNLVPLIDRRIRTFYFGRNSGSDLELLRLIHKDLQSDESIHLLNGRRKNYLLANNLEMSRLRALDIIVWMSFE